jgi:6-pyruvoyltetrahydropterin/6-carboxytetrahydropterin synthase
LARGWRGDARDGGGFTEAHTVFGAMEPTVAWSILIERGNLGFSAAHFITIDGVSEPLHGHNFGVRVEAGGELTPDAFLFNFITLKDIVRTLCKQWDHCFLLPLHNPHLTVRQAGSEEWEIRVDEHTRYVLPRSSVVTLTVDNATTERLAEQLARRIAATLAERGIGRNLRQLTVGIEETEMQTAFYTLEYPADQPVSQPP